MNRFALIFAFLVFVSTAALSQTATELHSRIIGNVTGRNYNEAVTDLRSISEREPEVFTANNYDYLLGRLCERTGDTACAVKSFNSVATRNSALRAYALWHLSTIARSSGNLLAERLQLMELSVASSDSLLADAVKRRMARSWLESKNYDLAIKALLTNRSARGTPEREDRLLLGRAYLYSGNAEAARGVLNELIASIANPAQPDDFALGAVRALDLIDVGSEKLGKVAPPLVDYEHLKRAQIYQFNRDFANARLHFSAIVNNHPNSGIVPDAIYQIGRGYSQAANFTEAVKWYERVGEQFAEHLVNKDALPQLASAYTRIGKHHEAIGRYEKYIQNYPDDERIDRAYLNIIDVYRDLGEEAEAMKWAAKAQTVFRGKTGEAQALFAQTRMQLARNNWNDALASLDKLKELKDLGGVAVPGGTSIAEITFLRGYVLEQLRRFPEAIDGYLSIPEGRNEYYGWSASDRLKVLAGNETAKLTIEEKLNFQLIETPNKDEDGRRRRMQTALRLTTDANSREKIQGDLKKAYTDLQAYKAIPSFKLLDAGRKQVRKTAASVISSNQAIADELLFLGLYDEAASELEAAKKGMTVAATDLDYTLAYYYMKGDRADRAATFIEPLVKLPADYQPELLPREIAEMLYPAPYADALTKHDPSRDVDPRFLLAIMRQESRFRSNVKSVAAARGLMQFISTTSEKIAGELGRASFDQDELYYPPTAILFGSQYVSGLFKMFPNKPDAVAASYNGGEDNMKRWYGRAKSDLSERYVPEIAFSQSKDYVHRVMANYRMYQLLYDERLNRK
jgi:soluble lytic murein transglycosylase-like protein/tetratricopeptide (TPR) repeat protein